MAETRVAVRGWRQERRPRNTGPSVTGYRAPTRGGARDGRDRNGSDRIGNAESVGLCSPAILSLAIMRQPNTNLKKSTRNLENNKGGN